MRLGAHRTRYEKSLSGSGFELFLRVRPIPTALTTPTPIVLDMRIFKTVYIQRRELQQASYSACSYTSGHASQAALT